LYIRPDVRYSSFLQSREMVQDDSSYAAQDPQQDFSSFEQTLIVFDWDDTLCPSHWLRGQSPELSLFKPPPCDERFLEPLGRLEEMVMQLLTASMKLGRVVIVTNAMEPWVEQSCKNFLPGIWPLVSSIPVHYARAVHSRNTVQSSLDALDAKIKVSAYDLLGDDFSLSKYVAGAFRQLGDRFDLASNPLAARFLAPGSSPKSKVDMGSLLQQWKEAAFREELCSGYRNFANVLSIGDSLYERDALQKVVSGLPTKQFQCHAKVTKLLDDPSIEELIQQLGTVHQSMERIVQHDGIWTLR
jgi:hypothetical protein